MKLTPLKKKKLAWSLLMLPLVVINMALMVTETLNRTWGGIIFIAIMVLVVYGNYRIDKKHMLKEAQDVRR